MKSIFVYGIILFAIACGSKSIVDCDDPTRGIPCQEATSEEKGKKAVKKGDFSAAVTYLEQAVEELFAKENLSSYERYRLHPLLASAYGAKAGINLVELSQTQLGGTQSLFASIGSVLPNPKEKGESTYRQCVADVKSANLRLDQIPKEIFDDLENQVFTSSVMFQRALYHTAYSVMIVNLFAVSPLTGAFDKAQLENMSEADALEILASLEQAGKVPQTSHPAMQQKIQETLSQIESEDGAQKKEKLAEYIAKNQ